MVDRYIPTQGQWNNPGFQMNDGPIGVMSQASQLYQRGGPSPYPFSTQAWFNPLQEQGYATGLMGAEGTIGQAMQNQALAHSLQAGFNQNLASAQMGADPGFINTIGGSFNPWYNPALDSAVAASNAAIGRDFNQTVMPGIASDAIATNNFNSTRRGITEGLAQQGLADAIAKNTADMYMGGFNTGMDRYVSDRSNTLNTWLGARGNANQAWGMAPTIVGQTMSANLAAPGALTSLGDRQSQIGSYYQGMGNRLLEEQKSIWDAFQGAPYQNLGWYSDIVAGNPASQAQTTTTQMPGTSPIPDIMGGAMTGYGLFQNMFGGGGGGGMSAPPMNVSNPWLPGGDLSAVGNFGGINWAG